MSEYFDCGCSLMLVARIDVAVPYRNNGLKLLMKLMRFEPLFATRNKELYRLFREFERHLIRLEHAC
jgi:hypothetical protein